MFPQKTIGHLLLSYIAELDEQTQKFLSLYFNLFFTYMFFVLCQVLGCYDDIWGIPAWEIIRCALPDNGVGYRIITTIRMFSVAE